MLLSSSSPGQPSYDGPGTPSQLIDMPFNIVSGALVAKRHEASNGMDMPGELFDLHDSTCVQAQQQYYGGHGV